MTSSISPRPDRAWDQDRDGLAISTKSFGVDRRVSRELAMRGRGGSSGYATRRPGPSSRSPRQRRAPLFTRRPRRAGCARLAASSGGDHPARRGGAHIEAERSWRSLPSPSAGARDLPRVGEENEAMLFYTSGTTGTAKGVPLTNRNLLFQIRAIADANFVREDDRVLLPRRSITLSAGHWYADAAGARAAADHTQRLHRLAGSAGDAAWSGNPDHRRASALRGPHRRARCT